MAFRVDGFHMTDGRDAAQNIEAKLRKAGLRPTRQRLDLARLLFSSGDRHVTAEELHGEALASKISVSLATVYNTLKQFTECGLLREVAIEGSKAYFDTKITDHQHFFFENDNRLVDLEPGHEVMVSVPKLPEGMKIARIDVLIRLELELSEKTLIFPRLSTLKPVEGPLDVVAAVLALPDAMGHDNPARVPVEHFLHRLSGASPVERRQPEFKGRPSLAFGHSRPLGEKARPPGPVVAQKGAAEVLRHVCDDRCRRRLMKKLDLVQEG